MTERTKRESERDRAREQDEERDEERGKRRETFILTLGQEKYTAENGRNVRK